MAKNNRGGRTKSSSISQASSGTYVQMTDAIAQQIRDEVDDRYDSDVVDAIKNYISKATDSNGFSVSQNLNYKLDNGLKLNATEQFVHDNIKNGMHDLSVDTTLTRACHDDILQKLGIKDYSKLSEAQLKAKLVGTEYETTAYSSFGYDDKKNPFISGQNSGGREVIIKAKTGKNTQVVFGAKSQGEIITNIGTQYRINDVYYSGATATPRNKGSKPVVVLEVETI